MPLWTEVITPAELTGYVRAGIEDYAVNQTTLAAFLPNDETADIVARVTSDAKNNGNVAQFRSYDAETPIGDRVGGSRKTIELPPLGKKVRVSEYEQLRNRSADTPEAVRNVVEREALRHARSIVDRQELARGQALLTGAVTIAENGLITEANYGRTAGHTVTAGTVWSSGSATPFVDLEGWQTTYLAANGEVPGAVLMSRRILSVLRGKLVGPGSVTGQASTEQVQAQFDDLGLGRIFVYDRAVRVGGTMTRVIPDDRVILLPAPTDPNNPEGTTLGATVWGRTLEASEPNYEIEVDDQPGIVAGAYKTDDPIAVWVKATAIALPVMVNPDQTFVADVL